MERVNVALTRAEQALSRLEEVLTIADMTDIVRDASIQRFEFTFECVWKAAQRVLAAVDGMSAASPKGVIRACRDVGLLSDEDTQYALEMVEDRNLTSHVYDESAAEDLAGRLPQHAAFLRKWLERVKARAAEE